MVLQNQSVGIGCPHSTWESATSPQRHWNYFNTLVLIMRLIYQRLGAFNNISLFLVNGTTSNNNKYLYSIYKNMPTLKGNPQSRVLEDKQIRCACF